MATPKMTLCEPDFFENVNGTVQAKVWLKVKNEPTGTHQLNVIGDVIAPPEMEVIERYPRRPGFKPNAPETSRAAAVAIKPDARSLRDAVLRVLRTGDYTADETADVLGCCILAIRPRFSELKEMARIVDTGIRRRNFSGKFACVWRIA